MNIIYRMNYTRRAMLYLPLLVCLASCKKYLDKKPDQKMVVPATLDDCQALLNNTQLMSNGYPYEGEAAADNYYLLYSDWSTLNTIEQDGYIWKAGADLISSEWSGNYSRVLAANQAIATLSTISPGAGQQSTWNFIRGQALFYRGFSFFNMAQIWTAPYDKTTAAQDMGIPLKLTPDLGEKTSRGMVQQTYDRIIQDLKEASTLLPAVQPATAITKSQPSKAAAYAALARVYLTLGDYTNASLYADSCLQLYSTLMNFSSLNAGLSIPIAKFNPEVIFQASTSSYSFRLGSGRVDSLLYRSFDASDLRRTVFFQDLGDGTYRFKGNYAASTSAFLFVGLATDEMYLTRAEAYARAGNTAAAMKDLNDLLKTRWQGPYTNLTAADANAALTLVLAERRKELMFRGLRWTDLRRLNKEPRFAVTLTRSPGGQTYTLPPNDPRYVLLIPQQVLQNNADLPQNPR